MPNTTGTFKTGSDLLNQLNTFITTNSWTKLKGETDLACASPKAAKFWRMLVIETTAINYNLRVLQKMEWRTTVGGPNVATDGDAYSFSSLSLGYGDGHTLVNGTPSYVRSAVVDSRLWWVQYEFPTPTIIREIFITRYNTSGSPYRFIIQWSHDGDIWTDMIQVEDNALLSNTTATFTFDDGYMSPFHEDINTARRTGDSGSTGNYDNFTINANQNNDLWCWRGLGYDADRRVYFSARSFSNPTVGTEYIEFSAHCSYDPDISSVSWMTEQEGSFSGNSSYLLASSSGGTFWFYVNSSRIIIVLKNGLDDYTSAYIGFLSSFADPDNYPFPLFCGATDSDYRDSISGTFSNTRSFCDPGDNFTAKVRLWNNVWYSVENANGSSGLVDDPDIGSDAWVWPWSTGSAGEGSFPFAAVGDTRYGDAHYLDRLDPTLQGDLPFIPAIVMQRPYGNVGSLEGVFCSPRGGILSPEQVVTIGGNTYKVFSNRAKTGGNHYYVIRED